MQIQVNDSNTAGFLGTEDLEKLAEMMRDFVLKALLPFVEKQVHASNSKKDRIFFL